MSENEQERRDEREEQRQERRDIRNDERDARTPISESTPIRLGLMLGLAALVVGLIVSSTWWAATISTKLDSIISAQSAQSLLMSAAQADISDLKAWRKVIDAAGSTPTVVKIDALSVKVEKLAQELAIHEAQDLKYQKPEREP